jgi:molecular chaperone HscB
MQSPSFDFKQDFFQLFGLSQQYRIDNALLDQRYHALQMQVHPDKFSHLSEAERRVSMQWATRVNEAYQTMASPISRARYLLSLQGVDTQEETNTAMPMDFLMQQMEWRDAIEEAQHESDVRALDQMELRLQHEMRELQQKIAAKIDDEHDYAMAAESVRKLKFMEKIVEEIATAFDAIDH